MPTDLGPPFPPEFNGIPPHMSENDFAIWQRWHALNYDDVLEWYFDAAVGTGAIVPAGTAPNMARAWTRLTQKRIDAIGVKADAVWIIEVRDSAGASALGAILTYLTLIQDDNPFSLPLVPIIITDHADQDSRRVIESYGVTLIEI